jgi:uncharacterized membrane protein
MDKGNIMHVKFSKYPIDLFICILWILFLIPLVLYDINATLRIIFGLPAILFIPGYVLIFSLFPTKNMGKGIDIIERIALSFGLSIAIVPLIGLALNYTIWGIRLVPILSSLTVFILGMACIGLYRFIKTEPDERFIISFTVSFPKEESRLDKALTIILIIVILVAVTALVYVIITPKTGEQFTEFYILGPTGLADDYPSNLQKDENTTVIVGIVNHEYRQIKYTVEVWLIHQTMNYNELLKQNETTIDEMWFINSTTITLNHTVADIESRWQPQWEKQYTLSLNKTGTYKLAFLLTINNTEHYNPHRNYADISQEKISNAYRSVHLWITIHQ